MTKDYNRLYSITNACKRLQTDLTQHKPLLHMIETLTNTCLECGDKLNGRIDKKFCSDACRISYNNKLNSNSTNYVRNITNILRRNRRALRDLNPEGKTKVTREKLVSMGFNFNYFTNVYTTREGVTYTFCYEQGYLQIADNLFLLVVRTETE
jgi:hypothetical protein